MPRWFFFGVTLLFLSALVGGVVFSAQAGKRDETVPAPETPAPVAAAPNTPAPTLPATTPAPVSKEAAPRVVAPLYVPVSPPVLDRNEDRPPALPAPIEDDAPSKILEALAKELPPITTTLPPPPIDKLEGPPLPPPASKVEVSPPPPPIEPVKAKPVEAPVPEKLVSPWRFTVNMEDGRMVLLASALEQEFKVVCDVLDLKGPRGQVTAQGKVTISGPNLKGSADKLAIDLREDRLLLEGTAHVKCSTHAGRDAELSGDRLTLRLSSTKQNGE